MFLDSCLEISISVLESVELAGADPEIRNMGRLNFYTINQASRYSIALVFDHGCL